MRPRVGRFDASGCMLCDSNNNNTFYGPIRQIVCEMKDAGNGQTKARNGHGLGLRS